MPNLPLAPWHGEHGRRAAGIQPLTGQGRRSRDCNLGPATPSDARGLQAYHCKPAPGRGKAARRGRLGDGSNRSVRSLTSARPGAPSRVARWGRNVPAVLGMKLSR